MYSSLTLVMLSFFTDAWLSPTELISGLFLLPSQQQGFKGKRAQVRLQKEPTVLFLII